MEVPIYSSIQAARMAGVTYRQLDYWTRNKLVSASIPSEGSGVPRRYSTLDIAVVRLVRRLSRDGLHLKAIRQVLSLVKELDANQIDNTVVVIGQGIMIADFSDPRMPELVEASS